MDRYVFHNYPLLSQASPLPIPRLPNQMSYRCLLKTHDSIAHSGTNDLGSNAFLTASQIPGKTLPDYSLCIFSSLDDLYALGARNFVLFNLAPLDLAPLYANESYGGVDASWLWGGKSESFIGSNRTATSEIMREYVRTVNQVYEYGLGFKAVVERRWKGSEVVLFDVHRLVSWYFCKLILSPILGPCDWRFSFLSSRHCILAPTGGPTTQLEKHVLYWEATTRNEGEKGRFGQSLNPYHPSLIFTDIHPHIKPKTPLTRTLPPFSTS
jgi:hypothetical protein